MRKLMVLCALILLCPDFSWAQNGEYTAEVNFFSRLTETFKVPGRPAEEFEYNLSPLALKLGFEVADTWSLEGRILYARLMANRSTDNAALGHLFDLEWSAGWHPIKQVRVYGGYTYSRLKRDLEFGQQTYNAVTTENGPLFGIGVTADHRSKWIARSSVDLYPYISVHDTFHPETGSFRRGNLGYRVEGAVGRRISDHMGLYFTGGYQMIRALEGEGTASGRHESSLKTAGVGFAFNF